MAIIKCDDVGEDTPIITGSLDSDITVEAYVEQDEVRLGKTLLAVESGFFLSDTLSPVLSDVPSAEALLKTRPQDITDSLRADSNRYWTLDEFGNMKYMNNSLVSREENVNSQFPLPPIQMALYNNSTQDVGQTKLGFTIVQEEILITRWSDSFPTFELFESFINGTDYPTNSVDPSEGTFTRTSPLIPTGSTFTDHAFQMDTPFSKKELEMFANIVGSVSVADVESDYDFFAKAYEEGIAPTTVPENALPHLYTEVQTSESTAALPKDYLRSWVSEILPVQDTMDSMASAYKNVAILDSIVGEENIIDSEVVSTSAFDILMAYANRENLFPMNVNVEVDTNKSSDVMFEAEYVGMVDDIVRMLMGDGDIEAPEDDVEFINQEVRQEEEDDEQKVYTPSGGLKVPKEIPELVDTVIDFKPRDEGKSDELDDNDNSLDDYGDGTLQS